MQQITRRTKAIVAMTFITLSLILSSFSSNKGGEGFEIYLNNKVVLQQFGNQMNTVKSIHLDQRFSNDQLVIKYHHCGQVGKNRSIVIRDAENKTLKEWKFANVSATNLVSDAAMACKVKDILSLQKNNPGKLSLYYSSNELPKGRLLANIVTEGLAKTK
ncbi:MAG TPA: hypothetical protein VIZ28_00070 [Chitinophagaceae bacterium]